MQTFAHWTYNKINKVKEHVKKLFFIFALSN